MKEKAIKARETVAYEYTIEMLQDGWTATHTENPYEKWDITATNDEKQDVVYIETKIRDYPLNSLDGGAYVDREKVDYISTLGKGAVIQYFWKSNAVFVWNIKERFGWPIEKRWLRKNNFTDEKVLKDVYVMPLDEAHRKYTIDITDYSTRFERIMTEFDSYDK